MQNNRNSAANGRTFKIPFHSQRNISSPEDLSANRKVIAGHIPAKAILELPTDENVRSYLVDAEGKQKRTTTAVHRAIKDTLKNNPEQFCILNGGIVIVARGSEVDEKDKVLILTNASIINGSQTQGVLRDFAAETGSELEMSVKFELIITNDEDLISEVSIARNFQNDVKTISIVGQRGELDEIDKHFRKTHSKLQLQKSETEWVSADNNYVQTEKLLQVIAALLPDELWFKPGGINRVYTYNSKATCLKDFDAIYRKAHDKKDKEHEHFKKVYQFYLDIAGQAYDLYESWKSNPAFEGCRLWCIERDGKQIVEVPDGLIFPILAALSEFAVQTKDGWQIKAPKLDDELVAAAVLAYKEIAKRPDVMGKTKSCYSQVAQVATMYKKFVKLA
ncbi:MAG TPA: AIPR family protein [Candidatus Acidoferrales bacterium]|jgi:hypothetical protein|nr:AIPR family protein [Candidatus Acidoferrales bacterium]